MDEYLHAAMNSSRQITILCHLHAKDVSDRLSRDMTTAGWQPSRVSKPERGAVSPLTPRLRRKGQAAFSAFAVLRSKSSQIPKGFSMINLGTYHSEGNARCEDSILVAQCWKMDIFVVSERGLPHDVREVQARRMASGCFSQCRNICVRSSRSTLSTVRRAAS